LTREWLTSRVDKKKAEAQFEQLVSALDKVGLRVEARDGRNGSVLVFVRIKSHSKFRAEVYRSRYLPTFQLSQIPKNA